MAKMIATRSMGYATRRLKAGDEFEARNNHARILNAIGRAKYATRDMTASPPPSAEPAQAGERSDDLVQLRARYHQIVGKRPFNGWAADELQRRISEAEGS